LQADTERRRCNSPSTQKPAAELESQDGNPMTAKKNASAGGMYGRRAPDYAQLMAGGGTCVIICNKSVSARAIVDAAH